MKEILILADIHANLPAFEAVLKAAGRVDACLFLGDVVGYGPQPRECVALLRELAASAPCRMLIGNHDREALAREGRWAGGPAGDGGQWEDWTAAQLDADARAFLRALPPSFAAEINGIPTFCCHHLPGMRGYVDDATPKETLATCVKDVTAPLVLFAHSHRLIDRRVGGKRLVCPGSVGQCRDGCPDAAFVVWNGDGIAFHRVSYDVERAVAALKRIPLTPVWQDAWAHNYRNGVVTVPPTRR